MKCRVLFGLSALMIGTATTAQAAEVIVHDDYDAAQLFIVMAATALHLGIG